MNSSAALILALGVVKAHALDPKTLAMNDYATCYSRVIKASGHSSLSDPLHEANFLMRKGGEPSEGGGVLQIDR
jgi:hypothetical protein